MCFLTGAVVPSVLLLPVLGTVCPNMSRVELCVCRDVYALDPSQPATNNQLVLSFTACYDINNNLLIITVIMGFQVLTL